MNATKQQKHTSSSGKYCHGNTEKKKNSKSDFGPEEDCGCAFKRQMVLVRSQSAAVMVHFLLC